MRLLNEEFSDNLSAMIDLIDAKVLNKSDHVVIGSILPTVVDAQLISLLKGQNPVSLAKSIVNSLFKILKPLQPLVLTLEGDDDLDPSSGNLLLGLMKQAAVDCPQLTIYVAFRNNPIIPLAASNLQMDGKHVTLMPFDENETEVFIKGYLGIDDQTIRIGKQLLDVVYDRSNGCRMFMEYIVRWALDKDMFEYADGGRTLGLKMIDDTNVTTAILRELSNIVLAAFNNISLVLWDALKIASCVRHSFNTAVYNELAGPDFLPRIKELLTNHDAFERCSGNRYKWKHQAVFETVKCLLMKNQRKELHNMIVKAFEERTAYFSNAGNLCDKVHGILVWHCDMAELWEGAYTQYMQAGKYAEDTHKFSNAVQMYEEAIAVQDRISKESLSARIDDKLLPKVRLGNCFGELACYKEVKKLLTECVAEAERV